MATMEDVPDVLCPYVKLHNRGYIHIGKSPRIAFPYDLKKLDCVNVAEMDNGHKKTVIYGFDTKDAKVTFAYALMSHRRDEMVFRPIRNPDTLRKIEDNAEEDIFNQVYGKMSPSYCMRPQLLTWSDRIPLALGSTKIRHDFDERERRVGELYAIGEDI